MSSATPREEAKVSSATLRIVAWSVILIAASLGLCWAFLRSGTPPTGRLHVSLVIVLAVSFMAECLPIHYEYNNTGHAVSLTEIPLVIGLYTTQPLPVVATMLCGTFLARVFVRRSPGIRLLFNTALTLTELTGASVVFAAVSRGGSTLGTRTWVAAGLGIATAIVIGEICMDVLLFLRGESFSFEAFLTSVTFSLTSIGSASIGVLIVVVLDVTPALFPVLVAITVLIGIGIYSYTRLRQRYRTLQSLHDFNSGANRSLHEVASRAVKRAQESLRATGAELAIVTGTHAGSRWTSGDYKQGPLQNDWIRQRAIAERQSVVIGANVQDPAVKHYMQTRQIKDLIVIPLLHDNEVLALLCLCDRMSEVGTFGDEDTQTLEAMGRNITIALANAELFGRMGDELSEQKFQSLHDPLTKLPNRSNFSQQLSASLQAEASIAVGILDVNRFKEINDTLGHDVGDEILIEVSRRLREVPATDFVAARLGGDEFALLFLDVIGEYDLRQRANALLQGFTLPYRSGDLQIPIDVAVGFASSRGQRKLDQKLLMKQADVAMYLSKRARQSTFTIYSEADDVEMDRRIKLMRDLRSAVERNELETYYQPKVDLARGSVVGVEALSRWNHEELGAIEPTEFIEIAEQAGLIGLLTTQILCRSMKQVRTWQSEGHTLVVALNIPWRLLREHSFISEMTDLLLRHDVAGTSLIFQVTEGVSEDDLAVKGMHELRLLGIGFAIDNYGTGSIALEKLAELPITELQIDRAILSKPVSQSVPIVTAAVATGKAFGLSLVAEGVETAAQWDMVRSLGCDLAQGYVVAPAIDEKDFSLWLITDALKLLQASIHLELPG